MKKTEGRKRHTGVLITIGALALAGAASIYDKSKKWILEKWSKMTEMMENDSRES